MESFNYSEKQRSLPRVAFYLAFPLAVFISAVIIFLGSYFGISGKEKILGKTVPHVPAKSATSEKKKAA